MRARVLVLPALVLLLIGLSLRHSTAVPSPSTVAKPPESPHQPLQPLHPSAPTPRPELAPIDPDEAAVNVTPERDDESRAVDAELPAVPPNTIHGHITDENGMPLAGVIVIAVQGNSKDQVATTGDSGYYALPNLSLGTYDVTYYYNAETVQYALDVDGKTELVAEPVIDTHAPPPEPIEVTIDDSELEDEPMDSDLPAIARTFTIETRTSSRRQDTTP